MIVLHGRGDSAEGFLWLQEALAIESLDFLLLTAPGRSWYGLPPDQLPGIEASRRLLASVFAETERQGFSPERTFLLGFSQGCLMTLEFGARHPRRLAGYVGISGYAYDPEALLRELDPDARRGAWLVTHGIEDELLPVTRTRAQVRRLREGGLAIDYREYPKGHALDPERELPEIRAWLEARIGTPRARGGAS
jgi:phospholipase/carboxylesterase